MPGTSPGSIGSSHWRPGTNNQLVISHKHSALLTDLDGNVSREIDLLSFAPAITSGELPSISAVAAVTDDRLIVWVQTTQQSPGDDYWHVRHRAVTFSYDGGPGRAHVDVAKTAALNDRDFAVASDGQWVAVTSVACDNHRMYFIPLRSDEVATQVLIEYGPDDLLMVKK